MRPAFSTTSRDAERERMEYTSTTARARPSTRPFLIATGAAFLVGAALAGYGVWRFGDRLLPGLAGQPNLATVTPARAMTPVPTPSATVSEAARQAVQAAQIVAEQQGGLDQRLAAAEQRIARLDLQAQAAAGNAARAEGLLIAFATRRALERGEDLGYLADQLRLRFGDAMPQAVQTLIAAGGQPLTLDQLLARLDGLAPGLARNGDGRLSWSRVRGELGRLFVVRRENTPSPQPRQRLERARSFLQSGRVEAAVAEVRNLPGVGSAAGWIRDAERYAAAQNALALIETAAVLEPRRLRDGAGRAIEQAAPVGTPAEPVPGQPQAGGGVLSGPQ